MAYLLRKIFVFIFRFNGWTPVTPFPKGSERCVMTAGPHTSNWDLIYMVACFEILKLPFGFAVKKEWLRFPFKNTALKLGAIGIDRSARTENKNRPSLVDSMAELFSKHLKLALVVAPEGTRSLRTEWKTGFYYTALKANVPIALGYLDYEKREAGVGKVIHPSGNIEKDMAEIMQFYATVHPRYPEKFSLDRRYLKAPQTTLSR